MSTDPLAIIVLAAGKGTRMGGELPKVAAKTCAGTLIEEVLENCAALQPERVIVVVGYGREVVEGIARSSRAGTTLGSRLRFALQPEQRGTADAVKAALPELVGFSGTVLILHGDVPLVTTASTKDLIELHHARKATVTLATFDASERNAYGRIVRDTSGSFVDRIVEWKDAGPIERQVREVNAGVYAVESAFLAPALEKIVPTNVQQEFYLTDIIGVAATEGQTVIAYRAVNGEEFLGVNTPAELALINAVIRRRQVQRHIAQGVTFLDPASVLVDPAVTIGKGSCIGPQVQLLGATSLGEGVSIEGTAVLINCRVERGAQVKLGVRAEDSVIGTDAQVGPFAHLRPGTVLGPHTKIGNFVEAKKAILNEGAKASHLTYLGDCEVGAHANIGAGTITCNYDGYNKFKTTIGAGAFIGSNTALVAPVTIGDGAIIGAGSTITKDVPADALALTRPDTTVREGWAAKKRATQEANKKKK